MAHWLPGATIAWGQVSGVPSNSGFTAAAAGDTHAVALRSDGSLVSWGYPTAANGLPTSGSFYAIDAGGNGSLALTKDGSIVWWGQDPYDLGLATVPPGNDFLDIGAGYLHALVLASDGSAVGWGAGGPKGAQPDFGQARPPKRNDLVAIAGGLYFSVALTADEAPQGTLADDFDDNSKAISWRLVGDDLTTSQLVERNGRLELGATEKTEGYASSYRANGWGIDPSEDFSLKVDFYQAVNQGVGLKVVLAPVEGEGKEYIKFGVTSSGSAALSSYEAASAKSNQNLLFGRQQTGGTLYVSYDAALDELYLSFRGYGQADAWATAEGFLQGIWNGQLLSLEFEGTSGMLRIESGQVYFDEFVIDSGRLVATTAQSVFRFWSSALGSHFYTIDEAERDYLIDEASDFWGYEGPVFQAATTDLEGDVSPVYRFWSDTYGTHFYTISQTERQTLLADKAGKWIAEGIAFYAHAEGQQPADAVPVYRFWSSANNAHFYTADEFEKETLLKKYPDVYTCEGIVFYVPGT